MKSASMLDPLVLLVEDDPGHARLVEVAVDEAGVPLRLAHAADGIEAEAFLRGADKETPALVLLDLNLPRKSGLQVLEEIKGDPELCSVPIVVLSCSSAPSDVEASYRAHANAYLVKPFDLEAFLDVVRVTLEFWLRVARGPDRPGRAAGAARPARGGVV
ncbi:MAG: response regulator [Deferrisomatales bacterium]